MSRKIFRTAFDRIISARELQVRRYVNGTLLSLDDDTLKQIGRSRDEIRREGVRTYMF